MEAEIGAMQPQPENVKIDSHHKNYGEIMKDSIHHLRRRTALMRP